jgi:hypothetical protein
MEREYTKQITLHTHAAVSPTISNRRRSKINQITVVESSGRLIQFPPFTKSSRLLQRKIRQADFIAQGSEKIIVERKENGDSSLRLGTSLDESFEICIAFELLEVALSAGLIFVPGIEFDGFPQP